MHEGNRDAAWEIVSYQGDSDFKRVRVRNRGALTRILNLVHRGQYVVLLAPHHHEKTRLLEDLSAQLKQDAAYLPIHINLWQAPSDDEQVFFESVQGLILRALPDNGDRLLFEEAMADNAHTARDLQNLLLCWLDLYQERLVLIVDHLHALPPDLVHGLLTSLRAARMEAAPHVANRLVAVVTGGVMLANLSAGPTSPFNIATPVFLEPWNAEQDHAVAAAAWDAFGRAYSQQALAEASRHAGGDPYLMAYLCYHSQELVTGYRQPHITKTTVQRAAKRIARAGTTTMPIHEAFQIIEEDPDTLLDALDILAHGDVAVTQLRQTAPHNAANRLLLCGAFVKHNGTYRVKNEIYRTCLDAHFTPSYVARVLRMNGRWSEAIDYLAGHNGAKGEQVSPTGDNADVLDAIIQEIYAAQDLDSAYHGLAKGLRLVFGLEDFCVYRVDAVHHQLQRVYGGLDSTSTVETIDLSEPDRVEVRTFVNGDYALRGDAQTFRLISALIPERRAIGIVTIERYWQRIDQEGLPPGLIELRRFLRHAATAIDEVMTRNAFQEIGRAVLDAGAVQDGLTRVLTIVANASGSDLAAIYLVDENDIALTRSARIGSAWADMTHIDDTILLNSGDPVAECFLAQRAGRKAGERQRGNRRITHDRIAQHVSVLLPLYAADSELGVLEIAFTSASHPLISVEELGKLRAFADQMAIAVYNMRLLQRTDEALADRVRQLEQLQDINRALVSTLELNAVLGRIVDNLRDLFPDSEVTIWSLAQDKECFIVSESSIADTHYRALSIDVASADVANFIVQSLSLRPASHLQKEPRLAELAAKRALDRMLAIPITSRGNRLGAITVYLAQDSVVRPDQEQALQAVADLASMAISNAVQFRQLRDVQTKLRRTTEQALYDVAAVLHHRLGNIVGLIPHNLKRVRAQLETAGLEPVEALALIEQRVSSLTDLLPAFRTIIDLDEEAFTPLDLQRVMEAALEGTPMTPCHLVEWDLPAQPVQVSGHALFLRDAFQSVFENACEAMPDGGLLAIRGYVDASHTAHVLVVDSGSGVPDTIRERVFELGFSTKRPNATNRGRGLFTCRTILRKHQGNIELLNFGSGGALFEITLPTV